MTAEHETECGYEQQAQAATERPAPPYRVTQETTKTPGTGRYKVTKTDGTVYYVTYGSLGMSCTCPDARHRNPGRCKHCVWIANWIGRPELVKEF